VSDEVPSFWDQWCPERGPALTHGHWNKCDPNKGHPGTGEKHPYNTCCSCGVNTVEWHNERLREAAEPVNVEDRKASPIDLPVVATSYDREDEPALAMGVCTGPSWGPGRGIMGFKLRGQLNLIAYIERTRGYR
jgi:hypothetical protein